MIEIRRVKLTEIKPYWRNPRKNEAAVGAVIESIQKYGYVQPILVDTDMTIIAGHTRYKALTRLGIDEVEIVVSDMSKKKAKEYRIVDNKTNELATWDMSALFQELGEIGEKITGFTDEELVKIIGKPVELPDVTAKQVDRVAEELEDRFDDRQEERPPMESYTPPDDWGSLEGDGGSEDALRKSEDPDRAGIVPQSEQVLEVECQECGHKMRFYYSDLIGSFKFAKEHAR